MIFRKALIFIVSAAAALCAGAAERSFSIVFGNDQTSTASLTNSTFINSVKEGKSYIEKVTSVVSVFPDQPDCIRLSSNTRAGGFNIWLSEGAQVVAKRIVLHAARYDNDRDADASLMVNSESLYIPDTYPGDYTLHIPSRPEKTLTNIIVDADCRVLLYSITVWYDDSQGTVDPEIETVATPQITPAGGSVSAGTNVSIACATADARIYYTIDGAVPTSASTLYEGPFAVYNDLTVKAFAVKDGMNSSEMAQADFTVRNAGAFLTAEFDFSSPATLNPSVDEPEQKEFVLLDGVTFTDGDAAVTFAATGDGNTAVRLYNSYDAGCDVRIYSGDCMTVRSMNPNIVLEAIEFEVSESGNSSISLIADQGLFDDYTWAAEDDSTDSVTFTSLFQSRIKAMRVSMHTTAGVDNVSYDHDVREEWYTIDGIRVPANIARPGFYIRKSSQGTSKTVIR